MLTALAAIGLAICSTTFAASQTDGTSEAQTNCSSAAQTNGSPAAHTDGASAAQTNGSPAAQTNGSPAAQIDRSSSAQTNGSSEAPTNGSSATYADGSSAAQKNRSLTSADKLAPAQSRSVPRLALAQAGSLPAPRAARDSLALEPVPHSMQTQLVRQYLSALQNAQYETAYRLLNDAARRYYRNPQNFSSVFTADNYRITRFALLGARGDDRLGRVFFARETARFRDHAHDVDLTVTATVPIGVVPAADGWRIKDPGHPWRAFAADAAAAANGVHVTVKKVSFFARRIEAVVSFVNAGPTFVTLLPYGKTILRDAAGRPYRLIETRDWSLTDKTLFEGLRLAPDAQYTGMLAFACDRLDDAPRSFALTVEPLLADGGDAPFAINVDAISAVGASAPAAK